MGTDPVDKGKPHERCGARTRGGKPCQKWPITGRARCLLHGGKSSGPKSLAGRKRIGAAHFIHGAYSKENVALKNEFQQRIAEMRQGRERILASLKQIAVENPEALKRGGFSQRAVRALKDLPIAEVE